MKKPYSLLKTFMLPTLLVGLLLLNSPPLIAAPTEPSTWAQRHFVKSELAGLLSGPLANPRDAAKPITREEFAELAVRLYLTITGGVLEELPQTHNFSDVASATSATSAYIGAAYRLNIVGGTSQTTFEPKAPVTREQIATMLHREITILQTTAGIKLPGLSLSTTTNAAGFADAAKISTWAKAGVAYVKAQGLIAGVGQNRFAPQETATREQVYKIAESLLTQYKKSVPDHEKFAATLNGYSIPKSSTTRLTISGSPSGAPALRLQSGMPSQDQIAYSITGQWLEVYDILVQKWGFNTARTVVLDAKSQWQQTTQTYGTPGKARIVYIDLNGKLTTAKPSAMQYIKLAYNGILIIDCIHQ